MTQTHHKDHRRQNSQGITELDLDIWEFVRLMVQLESKRNKSPYAALFALYQDAWQEIDEQLTDLAKHDHQAYSEMMLNHSIKLQIDSQQQAQLIAELFEHVSSELDALYAQSTTEEERHSFESEALALRKQAKGLRSKL